MGTFLFTNPQNTHKFPLTKVLRVVSFGFSWIKSLCIPGVFPDRVFITCAYMPLIHTPLEPGETHDQLELQ
jgi:hypothetical protein